jgi:hypothetical protein
MAIPARTRRMALAQFRFKFLDFKKIPRRSTVRPLDGRLRCLYLETEPEDSYV